MKIYMIRHGETDWNKKRKLQGQVDIPLNEFGKLLAKETAPALADVPFAVCYTSPLKGRQRRHGSSWGTGRFRLFQISGSRR